jgi:hypothetical protein
MQETLRSSRLTAEFITEHHRISGRVDLSQFTLADQLNSRLSPFLRLDEAYLSTIERPAEIGASYRNVSLRKSSILAALVTNVEDALPRDRSYRPNVATMQVRTFLTVPGFEIHGHLQLAAGIDPQVVVTTGTFDFITLQSGEMRSAACAGIVYTSSAMLVNKAHIHLYWMEQEGQASDSQDPGH